MPTPGKPRRLIRQSGAVSPAGRNPGPLRAPGPRRKKFYSVKLKGWAENDGGFFTRFPGESTLVHKFILLPVFASKMVDARTAPSPLRTTILRPPRFLECSSPATFMDAWLPKGTPAEYKAISLVNLSFPISPLSDLYCALSIDFLENLGAVAKYPHIRSRKKQTWQPGTLFLQIFLNLFR